MSAIRIILALLVALAGLLVAPSPAWAAGTVTVTVTGHGSVTGPGISCTQSGTSDCSQHYPDVKVGEECDPMDPKIPCVPVYDSQVVELTAAASHDGYDFVSWSGCDSAPGRVCSMRVDDDRGVTARYTDVAEPVVDPPSVTPSSSGFVRGVVTIAAAPTDNSGSINRVEFMVRGSVVASDHSAPYAATFDTGTRTDGPAAVRAIAFDNSGIGSFASPATTNITIDNTAPNTSITSGPADGTSSRTREVTFGLGTTEPGATFRCRMYRSGLQTPAFGPCSTGSTYSSTGLPDGTYVFDAHAVDVAGNVDPTPVTRTFTVDNVDPDTSFTHNLGQSSFAPSGAVTFFLSSTESGSTFRCRLLSEGAPEPEFASCPATHPFSGLAEGSYVFQVEATDPAGNVDDTPAQWTFMVDNTAPESTIATGPADGAFLKVRDVSLTYSADEPATFECRFYAQDEAPPAFTYCWTGTHTETGLPDGQYVFEVVAQDAARNLDPTPARRTFTIDTVAPETEITKHPEAIVKTAKRRALATFEFGANESTQKLQCKLDANAWKDCTSPKSYRVLKGKHTLKVRATDLAGNRDRTPAVWTWTVRRR